MIRRLSGAAGGRMVQLNKTTQPALVVVYRGAPLTQSRRVGERLFVIGSAFCLREGDIAPLWRAKSPSSWPGHQSVALGGYRSALEDGCERYIQRR